MGTSCCKNRVDAAHKKAQYSGAIDQVIEYVCGGCKNKPGAMGGSGGGYR